MENVTTYLNLAIALAIVLGGAVAFRYSLNRTANEIQERVINALQSEIQTLQDRIVALEKDNTRLSQTIALIRTALKQRGMSVTIDGDLVSISDAHGTSTHASRMQAVSPLHPLGSIDAEGTQTWQQ